MASAHQRRRITVGLVQMTSSTDAAENLAAATALVEDAAARGARFVATPEMTTLLQRRRKPALAAARAEADDPAVPAFRKLAAELGIYLLIGSLPVRVSPDKLANRSLLIGPDGAVLARYDKAHLFDVALGGGESYCESKLYEGGKAGVVAETALATFGLTVCYDLRFAYLYRALAQAGAQILTVPAAFTKTTGAAHWHVLLRARAIETGCFVLAPAQVGEHADGRSTYGHSLIVAPWGEVLADGGQAVGVTLADLDLGAVNEARERIPALTHDRPLDIRRAGEPPAARSA